MDGLVSIGAVPDPVLLLCGRPGSMPSAWWTPSLAALGDGDAEQVMAEVATMADEEGLRDPTTGRPTGALGEVADVVGAAEVVLLLRTELAGDGPVQQRAVVAAPDRALFDLQVVGAGTHDLLLADPATAVQVLASFLVPDRPPQEPITRLAGRRTPGEVAAALPEDERTATTLLTHSVVGDEGARALTLLEHPTGTAVCWATPGGSVEVQPLDEAAAIELAGWLLRAEAEVPT